MEMSTNNVHDKGLVVSIDGVGGDGVPSGGPHNTDNNTTRRRAITNQMKMASRRIFSRSTLEQRLPILKWAPQYNLDCLQGDVMAGLTVGLTVIPQGIAYALVAGVPANFGLYSAFVGCFVYMVFGSCKDITIGPTAIMAIMTHEYTKNFACPDDPVATAQVAVLLTFLTGAVILLATVFRIGFLITFIGRPVITGFTSAAAITIATSQLKGLLGLSFSSEGFIDTWRQLGNTVSQTRWQDLVLGLVCIVLLLALKYLRDFKATKPLPTDEMSTKVWKKLVFLISVGRNAIIVIASSLLAYGLDANQPFGITGNITAGMPDVLPPHFSITCTNGTVTEVYDFKEVAAMLGSGIVIVPMIAILEDIAIASAFSQGKSIDATQEMLALSLCNLAGSFFQSIPTTGSFSRTAINSTSGVKTPAGGAVTGTLIILALMFLTPYFKFIPKSTLSAVIICAVIYMIDFHDIKPIWRIYKLDQVPLWTTFVVCLMWKLEWGILVGAGSNIAILLYRQARPSITVVLHQSSSQGVVVVQPALGLLFPSADHIKLKLSRAGMKHLPLLVVLDCAHVAVVDYTSSKAIQNVLKEFDARNQRVVFANLRSNVRASLLCLLPKLEEVDLFALLAGGADSRAGGHADPLTEVDEKRVEQDHSDLETVSPTPLLMDHAMREGEDEQHRGVKL